MDTAGIEAPLGDHGWKPLSDLPFSRPHNYSRQTSLFVQVALLTFGLCAHQTHAEDLEMDDGAIYQLKTLSLEDLVNIQVTSVGKKAEKLAEAPAAIYVITGEELRRTGATTFPDAFRLVPGMQVARVDGHNWAVSARGFNDVFANKLLVLIDGRSVYTPLFSGVLWDTQDTLMEDIDRIEVIRGPGATLWGANAVNGVINIITKSAKETQGGIASGGGGTEERGFASFRYGGRLSDNAFFRVYGKYLDRDESVLPFGGTATDAWNMARGGFRMDFEPSEQNLLTLQGDAYGGDLDQTFNLVSLIPPTFLNPRRTTIGAYGGNVLGRWTHILAEESDLKLQMYYDRTVRDAGYFEETHNIYDVEFQHRLPIGDRQDLVWGTGYRAVLDAIPGGFDLSFDPVDRGAQVWNAFIQDEIQFADDSLRLTLGSKFEHNDYTGFEIQPGGRLLWTPNDQHSVWLSVARAVRTPSRAEDGVIANTQVMPGLAPGFPPTVVAFLGNSAYDAEELTAYELGYRIRPFSRLSLDIATFYNDYDQLRSLETGTLDFAFLPEYLKVPISAANNLTGETYGVEFSADAELSEWWRLRGSYSYLQAQLHTSAGSTDTISEAAEGSSPHHQVSFFSLMNLPHNIEVDTIARYVDSLSALGIRSYFSLDLHLGWRPRKQWEISIVGQNLLDSHRTEFGSSSFVGTAVTEVQRSVYGRVTFRF